MPRSPYLISGVVYETDGSTVVSGAHVWIEHKGYIEKLTTNTSGQYTFNLANLPDAHTYSNGQTVLLTAWKEPTASTTAFLIKNYLHTIDTTIGTYDYDFTLEVVKYETLKYATQSVIYWILKNDSLLTHFNPTIVNSTPNKLTREVGFPYIIVRTPTVNEENIPVIGTSGINKYKILVSPEIQIYTKREGRARQLADAVRNALKTNKSTTETANLYLYRYGSDDIFDDFLDDGSKVIVQTSRPEYNWYGG